MNAPITKKLVTIALDQIDADPNNPRKIFRGVEELAADVREHGVIQPITVRPVGDRYMVVFGERRWRAAKLAELGALDCVVRDLSDAEALELQIVENDQREDVHAIERSGAYQRMREEFKYDVDAIAAKVNKSKSSVYASLKLARLTPESRQACLDGKVSASIALELALVTDPEKQNEALVHLIDQGEEDGRVSVREARWAIRRALISYELDPEQCGFSPANADLVPSAGACTSCPHNSANIEGSKAFAEDEDDAAEREDVCTHPPCFEQKRDAAWVERRARHESMGLRVLSDKEAKKILAPNGTIKDKSYQDITEKNYDAGRGVTLKKLLGERGAAETVLARDSEGVIRELIPAAAARTLLKELHPKLGAKSKQKQSSGYTTDPAKVAETRAKLDKERRRKLAGRHLAAAKLVAKCEAAGNYVVSQRLLVELLIDECGYTDDAPLVVAERRGVAQAQDGMKDACSALARLVPTMKGPEVLALGLELLAMIETPFLARACKAFGVDLKACEKQALAEFDKAEAAAAAKTKDEPQAKATAKAKPAPKSKAKKPAPAAKKNGAKK